MLEPITLAYDLNVSARRAADATTIVRLLPDRVAFTSRQVELAIDDGTRRISTYRLKNERTIRCGRTWRAASSSGDATVHQRS